MTARVTARVETGDGAMERLAPRWDALYASAPPDLFLSRPWIACWLRYFGTFGAWRILCVERGDELIGLVPFQIVAQHRYGITVRKLQFLTRDSLNNECAGVLVAHSNLEEVNRAFFEHVRSIAGEWDIVELVGFEQDSLRLNLTAEAIRDVGLISSAPETVQVSRYLDVRPNWDQYLKARGKHFRKHLRNERNRLAKLGNLVMASNGGDRSTTGLYDDAMRVVLGRIGNDGNTRLSDEDKRVLDFVRDLVELLDRSNAVDLHVAYLDDAPLSCVLSFIDRGIAYAVMTKYDMAYARYSPGRAVLGHMVEHAHNCGLKRIDFLSDWPHVRRYTDDIRSICRLRVYHNGLKSRLLRWRHRSAAANAVLPATVQDDDA